MRRVVVTGLGLVTPLACGVEATWQKLTAGKSALGNIKRFDEPSLACQVVAEVPFGGGEEEFDPKKWIPAREIRKMDNFIQYGVAASVQAIADSGWKAETEEQQKRTGVLIGSGIGGLPEIENTSAGYHSADKKKVSPFFIPATLINLVSGHVSIMNEYRGPNHSVVTACSTGAHAIGDAARMIMLDDADVMVAGSAEGAICPISLAGFGAARALSTAYNDTPQKASRPWDKGRDGFVMGEGAGIVVLEEYEHAKKRGAKIYGELIGYGLSGDAYHITSPHPEGRGAYDAMDNALRRSGIAPSDIDYVNAHGTSTPMGDMIELGAVKRLFGDAITTTSISSTKSSIGHLLGGAGSVEAIFSILAMRDGILPPTLNLDEPDDEALGVDLVPHVAKEKEVNVALSNSFGFGGTNVSLVFKKV